MTDEFFTHKVEQPYDWTEWVCPDPKGYLMKCCDCGLVHEAEFGVVRYKSETAREDCDFVDDPNLQAVFRMRRSEQWSPADTAHRAGGLPMEQPAQPTTTENNGGKTGWPPGLLQDDCKGLSKWLSNKPDAKRRVREALDKMAENARELGIQMQPAQQEPVACPDGKQCKHGAWCTETYCQEHCEFRAPPQRKPLTDEEILSIARDHYNPHQRPEISFARAIEAKLKEKNT